ncbi:MAG: Tex family protein [Bacteroidota bacterium]
MMDLVNVLAGELSLGAAQIRNALQLHEEGGTIPFIARYRKERTGEMAETQLRALFDRYRYLKDLQQRKETVSRTIEGQGKLTEELRAAIDACLKKHELEDLYLPFKPKKRTRATVAKEKGLGGLADFIKSLNSPDVTEADLAGEAEKYLSEEKGVATAPEALAGASHILAEEVAQKAEHRAFLRDHILDEGVFVSAIREKFPPESTKFEMYRDYRAPVKSIQPHNVLALRRGERSGVLQVSIAVNEEFIQSHLESSEIFSGTEAVREFYRIMLRDAYDRLMREPLTNEVRAARKELADRESIKTFEANLRDVLLAPPAGMKPSLAIDPGFRTGCKLAVLDGTGKFIDRATIYPHGAQEKREDASTVLKDLLEKHTIELIAIGNGTASRETEQFVGEVLAGLEKKPVKVIVNESGASVYSVSKAAKEELPSLDVTVRGAISIGRRLQDPLAELVKIEPKSIGVGQYQHDVDQKLLRRKLEETVQSCVNYVGVNLNTASRHLLRHVAGINGAIAASIVAHRNRHGPFTNRERLRDVPQMGPKSFEQAAGFLRIHDGDNPLDSSAVHPESYDIARRILTDAGIEIAELGKRPGVLKGIDLQPYITEEVGEPTLRDIVHELQRPGRDPRKEFRYATFKEGVKEIKDLAAGMDLEGVITNVTNFGAFVDIGVHHDGLVHVSQLADRYVADPKAVVKVGQVVKVRILEINEHLKRISLTMKGLSPRPKKPKKPNTKKPPQQKKEERSYTIEDLKSKFNNR